MMLMEPIIANDNIFHTSKQYNPWSGYPRGMALHAYGNAINSSHKNIVSEALKVSSHTAQSPKCIVIGTCLLSPSSTMSQDVSRPHMCSICIQSKLLISMMDLTKIIRLFTFSCIYMCVCACF
jgi:hypothetical protein